MESVVWNKFRKNHSSEPIFLLHHGSEFSQTKREHIDPQVYHLTMPTFHKPEVRRAISHRTTRTLDSLCPCVCTHGVLAFRHSSRPHTTPLPSHLQLFYAQPYCARVPSKTESTIGKSTTQICSSYTGNCVVTKYTVANTIRRRITHYFPSSGVGQCSCHCRSLLAASSFWPNLPSSVVQHLLV